MSDEHHTHDTHHDRDDARFDDETNTRPKGDNYIDTDLSDDGLDRRGFLRCMAWAGTATVWAMSGGVPKSFAMSRIPFLTESEKKSIFFAQISDSHIGFNKEANPDVAATLREAVAKLNALPERPAFVLHTGDITQLAKPSEFDTANEILKEVKTDRVLYVPGEHDVATDNGVSYLARYGKGTKGGGWYSFDHQGVHFVDSSTSSTSRPAGSGRWGPSRSRGSRRTSKGSRAARRSCCSRTSRCGRSTRSGDGARTTPRRRSRS